MHSYIYIYAIMKTMCPPGYCHNGLARTHALGHIMHGYTSLVSLKQSLLSRLSKERIISGHK